MIHREIPEAYRGVEKKNEITIPKYVTSIKEKMFQDCTWLTKVTISEGVTSIGKSAFEACSGLKQIVIPESVTTIEAYAFYRCVDLETICCRADEQPEGWSGMWKYQSSAQVIWGYKD